MKRLLVRLLTLLLAATAAAAQMRVMAMPGKSPIVNFRIVFTTGSAYDAPDKPGVAYLTAMMLANGGAKDLTYQQISDAMYPMAAGLEAQVDKEMTSFTGATHVDNLNAYYKLLRAMLLEPGWRDEDFQRVKDDAINAIRVGLQSNDEALAKETLYEQIFRGTSYAHYTGGTVESLQKLTLDDLRRFYRNEYSQSHLILGIAGGYPPDFASAMRKDFRDALPAGAGFHARLKPPPLLEGSRVVILQKDTRSVACSIGFPISVTRSSFDYAAMLLAASYFGQHRMSGGVLYEAMRERRGLNYGDYSYIEYFPRGMFLMEPPQNVLRRFNTFEMWIRPVEPPNAVFAIRLALYELDKLIRDGIPAEAFERTRNFLNKYVNVLTRSDAAALGYATDSIYTSLSAYPGFVRDALSKLTREEVNRSIRSHLRTSRLIIAAVAQDAEGLKTQLAGDDPSPITYNSPKPEAIMEEDKIVSKWPLHLRAEDITIVPQARQ